MGDNKLLALNNVDVSIKEGEFVSIMGSPDLANLRL